MRIEKEANADFGHVLPSWAFSGIYLFTKDTILPDSWDWCDEQDFDTHNLPPVFDLRYAKMICSQEKKEGNVMSVLEGAIFLWPSDEYLPKYWAWCDGGNNTWCVPDLTEQSKIIDGLAYIMKVTTPERWKELTEQNKIDLSQYETS